MEGSKQMNELGELTQLIPHAHRPTRISSPSRIVGIFHISTRTAPLKIFQIIVRWVAVQMIYVREFVGIRYIHNRQQAVDEERFLLSVFCKSNNNISIRSARTQHPSSFVKSNHLPGVVFAWIRPNAAIFFNGIKAFVAKYIPHIITS